MMWRGFEVGGGGGEGVMLLWNLDKKLAKMKYINEKVCHRNSPETASQNLMYFCC